MVSKLTQLIKNRHGFTLLELLIVVGILGIIISAGLASYSGSQKNARDGRRKTDLEIIRQALELYKADNGVYPDALGDTETKLKPFLTSPVPYINANSFPNEPKYTDGIHYTYERLTDTTYNICALLESPDSDDPACLSPSLACQEGTQEVACNYGVANP